MAFKKRGTSKSKRYPSKKSVALKLDEVRPRKSLREANKSLRLRKKGEQNLFI